MKKARLLVALLFAACLAIFGVRAVSREGRLFVERQASLTLGASTTVETATLDFFPPGIRLGGVRLQNPPGYDLQPLASIDNVLVHVAPRSILSSIVEVPEVAVDGLFLWLEKAGGKTNLEVFKERVFARLDEAPSSRRVVILRLSVHRGRVSTAPLGHRMTVPLKDVELRNLGRDKGGLGGRELADLLFRMADPNVGNAIHNVNVPELFKGIRR